MVWALLATWLPEVTTIDKDPPIPVTIRSVSTVSDCQPVARAAEQPVLARIEYLDGANEEPRTLTRAASDLGLLGDGASSILGDRYETICDVDPMLTATVMVRLQDFPTPAIERTLTAESEIHVDAVATEAPALSVME